MRAPSLRTLLLVIAMVPGVVLAACGGNPPSASPSYPPGAIVVTANARKFDTSQLLVPADTKFTLVFVNKESDPHNLAIRTEAGFDGDLVFRFDAVSATTVVLEAGPVAAGTYYFLCEVHPTMTGTVIAH